MQMRTESVATEDDQGPRAADATAHRWAGIAGVVAGLAGLGLAGLAAWLFAPAGAPVTAVGELIIALLPAALVNFGKEVLGFADKPILLTIIVLGVLALCRTRRSARVRPPIRRSCGVRDDRRRRPDRDQCPAGRAAHRVPPHHRRAAARLRGPEHLDHPAARLAPAPTTSRGDRPGAPSSAGPWPLERWPRSLPSRDSCWPTRPAPSARRRERLELPRAAKPAAPPPSGADLDVPDLTQYVTPNDSFYRIDTALQLPVIDPETWTLKITGMVDNRDPDRLRRARWPSPWPSTWPPLTCVSNQVGGDLAGNAVWLGCPSASCWPRPARSRAPTWCCRSARTAGRRHPAERADRPRPAGAAGRRDERRTAAARARLPGADGRAGPLRRRVGHQVGHRAQGDHLRRGPAATGRSRAGRHAGRSRSPPGSTSRPARCRARHAWWWPASPGPRHRHLGGRGADRRRTLAGGRARRDGRTGHLAAVGVRLGRRPRATTTITVRATDADGRLQTDEARRRSPTGPPDYHQIQSRSAESRQACRVRAGARFD